MAEKIQLTKKDRLSVAWRHQFLQGSWNYERMQNGGWCYSIIHVVDTHILISGRKLLAAVRNDQQFVAQQQFGLALRHEILAVAADHHHQRIFRQRDVLEHVPAFEHRLIDLHLRKGRLHILMHIDAEGRFALFVSQPQQVGHAAHGGALHQQRNDRAEEYDVEQQSRVLHMRHQGIDGEENRHGAAQSHPRHVEPRLGGELAERGHADEDRQRARHQNHERPHQSAQNQHTGFEQFVAVDEQTQREEHHDLHEPRKTVEEDRQRTFLLQLVVSDDQPRKVDGQIAVALDQVGEGEREKDERQQQHRVERMVGEVDAVDRPDGQTADQVPRQGADDHLHDEKHHAHTHSHAARTVRHHADEQNGHHIGHRVVRAALQLQQGPQVLLQPLLLASQDRENRSRVGRGHRGGEQQRQYERHLDP